MFDIGFFELLLISVVGLLVFGPEQFLDAVRTTGVWVRRIRRSFDEVRSEVQRELHNDAVMRQLKDSADSVQREFQDAAAPIKEAVSTDRWSDLVDTRDNSLTQARAASAESHGSANTAGDNAEQAQDLPDDDGAERHIDPNSAGNDKP